MKKSVIAHPFLFAVLPLLILFSTNVDYIPASQLTVPLIIVLGLALAVILIMRIFIKEWLLAGLMASPLILILLASGKVYEYLSNYINKFPHHHYILLFIAIILIFFLILYISLLFGFRESEKLRELNAGFNVIAAVLVLFNLSAIIFHHYREPSGIEKIKAVAPGAERPDVYFIVLDQFASLNEIKDVFGYDNSAFGKRLAGMGFYIVGDSKTRFLNTDESLSDTLNMGEISLKPDTKLNISYTGQVSAKEDTPEKKYSKRMIRENKVARIFKSFGYRFINIGSSYTDTSYNKFADENINCSGFRFRNELNDQLAKSSVLSFALIPRGVIRNSLLNEFERLSQISPEPGPKFVLAHFLSPHMPFVFGPNGEKIPLNVSRDFGKRSLYLGQYIFTAKKAEETVSRILSGSKTSPIIVLVSDHGSKADREYVHNIFCAIHLPDNGNKKLNQHISSRNIFRVILNDYFGQDLPLLS